MAVTLEEHMGGDLTIVNAARVSLAVRHDKLLDADRHLINYLTEHKHGTCFEHVVFRFRVRTTIAVAREWFRHRTDSYNELSTRYKEMDLDQYIPTLEDMRTQVGKPGRYTFEPLDEKTGLEAQKIMAQLYADMRIAYTSLLSKGVAKEVARNVLPLGQYTEFIWTVKWRNLTNFLRQRTASDALLEIRREADAVEALVAPLIPTAYKAWVKHGRQSL